MISIPVGRPNARARAPVWIAEGPAVSTNGVHQQGVSAIRLDQRRRTARSRAGRSSSGCQVRLRRCQTLDASTISSGFVGNQVTPPAAHGLGRRIRAPDNGVHTRASEKHLNMKATERV